MDPPCLKIAGPSDSGKTTLIERLVPVLQQRGWRVAVIKHDPHDHWTWDRTGTDTDRLARAGADGVAILSPGRFGLYQPTEQELSVEALARKFEPVPDLVLLEGFKGSAHPGFSWQETHWVDADGTTYEVDDLERMVRRIEGWRREKMEDAS